MITIITFLFSKPLKFVHPSVSFCSACTGYILIGLLPFLNSIKNWAFFPFFPPAFTQRQIASSHLTSSILTIAAALVFTYLILLPILNPHRLGLPLKRKEGRTHGNNEIIVVSSRAAASASA